MGSRCDVVVRTTRGQDRTAHGQEYPAAGCQEKLSGLQMGTRDPSSPHMEHWGFSRGPSGV